MDLKESIRINSRILTEEQIQEIGNINTIINEELGINDEANALAKSLTSAVCENHEDDQEYDIKIAGDAWHAVVHLTDADKDTSTKNYKRDYLGVTYFGMRTIVITAYRVGGKINPKKFTEVAAHEILHAFNISSSKKDGYIKSERNKNIYVIGATQARNGKTELDRCIGYVIYLSNKFEANAFENGLYSYLMSCDLMTPGDEEKAMTETMMYKRLMILKRANEMIEEDPVAAEKIISETYGKTLPWLRKLASSSLKNCRRQVGRALMKFRKDYDWTHGGKNLISV